MVGSELTLKGENPKYYHRSLGRVRTFGGQVIKAVLALLHVACFEEQNPEDRK